MKVILRGGTRIHLERACSWRMEDDITLRFNFADGSIYEQVEFCDVKETELALKVIDDFCSNPDDYFLDLDCLFS